MADDPERDVYPIKEMKELHSHGDFEIHVPDRHISIEKRTGPHITRSDLEDQFYKFKEENYQLKRAAKKQEDELKRLATKMTRLLREKKNMELKNSPGHRRDLELEEMVEDLQDKVRQLEKTNSHLREKMLVAKQQVINQVRRPNPYSHIPPKVNSGTSRSGISPYFLSLSIKGKSPQSLSRKPPSAPIPPYAISLLEEARNELSNLKILVSNQKSEIELYEQENEILKQKLRMREIEFDEELNGLKCQLTQRQRQHVQENLDLIRLHREVKQKNTKFMTIQAQYADLEEKMRALKSNHDHLVKEMEDLAFQYKAEQKKNLELLGELQKAEINAATTIELQERIKNIQKENEMLRETNDKLIKSTLAVEKERTINQMEDILKEKISNLEASLQFQIREKNAVEQEYNKEKEIFAVKEEAHAQLKDHFNQVKSHLEELEVKVNVLKSDVSFDELGEALSLLKLKKDNKISFVDDIPQAELDDLRAKLEKSELDHVETVKELHNIRDMLMTQYDVNKAAQVEVKALTEKLDQQEKEFSAKVEEFSHLLDIRAARIQKLEKQLNDIAYGTKSFTIPDDECDNEMLKTETLSRGENIFEIHIVKIDFNNAGEKKLGSNPNVFMTWNFYEFELQSTPVVPPQKPRFNFTAQYNVQVDDYFLCYLHESSITLELHECFGLDYKTIATSQLHFSDIISKSVSRIHGTQSLISIEDSDVVLGSVEFWVRLRVPMEESFKLFKEKLKALKYIHHNKEMSSSAVNLLKQPVGKDLHVNELHIKIIRGLNLSSSQRDVQPSTFCVYKFYDLPDQDTVVIPASNNPEFSDHRTFSLHIDYAFEKYIRTENLFIYVFDENEPDITSYIGRAEVLLHPLSQNQPIKGVFQLRKDKDLDCGSIEILIYWQYDYIPFSSENVNFTPQPERSPTKSIKSSSSDEEIVGSVVSPKRALPTQPPVPKPRRSVPSKPMTSTPLIKKLSPSSSSDSDASNFSAKLSRISHQSGSYPLNKQGIELSNSSTDNDLKISQQLQSEIEQDEDDVIPGGSKQMIYEEVSDEEKENFSDEESDISTDDEEAHSQKSKTDSGEPITITITVSYLILNEDAAVLADDNIKILYVEYRFLDYPLEELETPLSLPKVEPPEKINFNFEKVFQIKHKDIERWNLLSQMLFSEFLKSSLIKFTVVSEPSEDDGLECEELGFGFVDLCEVLKKKRNIIGEDIFIYDASDPETPIGRLNVTIKALDALLYIKTIMES